MNSQISNKKIISIERDAVIAYFCSSQAYISSISARRGATKWTDWIKIDNNNNNNNNNCWLTLSREKKMTSVLYYRFGSRTAVNLFSERQMRKINVEMLQSAQEELLYCNFEEDNGK